MHTGKRINETFKKSQQTIWEITATENTSKLQPAQQGQQKSNVRLLPWPALRAGLAVGKANKINKKNKYIHIELHEYISIHFSQLLQKIEDCNTLTGL